MQKRGNIFQPLRSLILRCILFTEELHFLCGEPAFSKRGGGGETAQVIVSNCAPDFILDLPDDFCL